LSIALLSKKIQRYSPKSKIEMVQRAYDFACEAHSGQHRISGELFIFHPLEVAKILADLELDIITICAGLLHDVVEDTDYTLGDIEENFGEEVALLVDGVTKLSKLEYKTKEEQQAENLRKMFLAMAKDIRVILIKLADRLHNMRTLRYLSSEKRIEKAEETLEIFAPLAHRLGISKIQWELEDLALLYLEPKIYKKLSTLISKRKDEREEEINLAVKTLKVKLENFGLDIEIQGRSKHFYSIYKKMKEQNKSFDQIYDLTAIRIIVKTIRDCYAVLGTVHTLWKPIPGLFKDYVAMPKPNMYQSLHTTVIGPEGEPLEIQIRTWDMHRTAEYGIAAHWKYKEGVKADEDFEKKLSWLRELLEWQRDLKDAREFMETIKIDLFTDEVFVFTPKGDVIDLPAGSVPIDFAYKIHTDVGHNCSGAKVNGRIVQLNYKLKNGDIVEILTTSHINGPSRDWLNIVKSSRARNKIRQWFKKEAREDNILKGREMLEREIKRARYPHKSVLKQEYLEVVTKRLSVRDTDDLFASIGYGGVTVNQVLQRLLEEYRKNDKSITIKGKPEQRKRYEKKKRPVEKGVKVKGVDNLLIRFSKCCNPVPDDEIIGYITRGRGISIHRKDCPNVAQHLNEKERLIEVEWDKSESASYSVEIQVAASDRGGLLSDVINTINELKIVILAVNARTNKNNIALIDMTLQIKNKEHLQTTIQRLKRVEDVISVNRILPN